MTDGSFLFGVTAASPSDAWAAGWYYGPGGENSNNLALHWNGTRWAVVPSPNPVHLGFNVLNGVSAPSSSDAWATGSYQNAAGSQRTLILHWNGTNWATVASPNPGDPDDSYLSAVSALPSQSVSSPRASSPGAWAVGYYSTSSGQKSLILHWNGTRWTHVASPGPLNSELKSVNAVSPSDAWAAGDDSTSSGEPKTLILRWNGTTWATVASPDPGGTTGTALNGVSALSPSDAWAVGSTDPFGSHGKTVILHWNGTSWTRS